ncbi:MAG TPA: sialate O-acetylesterase [Chloroflexota bacterium]|nr:sialate O-acetylesterase [Chloroflexota bacterium]
MSPKRYVRTASGWRPVVNAARVFLLWGQSNVRGQASLASLPADLGGHIRNAYVWNGSIFVPLTVNSGVPETGIAWGPEMRLAFSAAAAYPAEPIFIIKHAAGGIPLALTTAPTWNTAHASSYYAAARNQYSAAVAWLQARGYTPVVQGFLWGQGETDANNGVTRATYTARLTELFAGARELVGNTALPIADMLIYGTDAGRTAINGAKTDVAAAVPGITLVDTNIPSWINTDLVHLSGTGQSGLGLAAFNAFK